MFGNTPLDIGVIEVDTSFIPFCPYIYIKKSANSRSDNEHLQVPTYVHDIFEHTTKISSKQKFCVTLAQVKIDWSAKVNNSCNLMSKITLNIYVS